MRSIAKNSSPIQVIVHYPRTEAGLRELAKRTADVHADMVICRIQKLNCSSEQKKRLLDAMIRSAAKEKNS